MTIRDTTFLGNNKITGNGKIEGSTGIHSEIASGGGGPTEATTAMLALFAVGDVGDAYSMNGGVWEEVAQTTAVTAGGQVVGRIDALRTEAQYLGTVIAGQKPTSNIDTGVMTFKWVSGTPLLAAPWVGVGTQKTIGWSGFNLANDNTADEKRVTSRAGSATYLGKRDTANNSYIYTNYGALLQGTTAPAAGYERQILNSDGATSEQFVNNVSIKTGNAANGSNDGLGLGGLSSPMKDAYTMKAFSIDRILSAPERAILDTWLAETTS